MIAAVETCSFVDFPGHLAAVAFTQGCNLRCRYCHNPGLCARKVPSPQVEKDFLHLLSRRRGLLTGVVVSGGEPTLWPDLERLLVEIRALGFAVKLDTNGTSPAETARLLDRGLVDYLAVDIKAPPGAKSFWLCGHDEQATLALETLSHAAARNIVSEARTVLVHGVHDQPSLTWISENLAQQGLTRWRLTDVQTGHVLDPTVALEPPELGLVGMARSKAKSLGLDVPWSSVPRTRTTSGDRSSPRTLVGAGLALPSPFVEFAPGRFPDQARGS